GESGHRVAERARQNRGTDQRVIFAAIEDVDEQRQRVAAARERGAGDDVERDPESERIAVGERGRSAESGDEEAPHDQQDAERAEREEDEIAAREELST